jgi:dolichol-phosphate mannosyltransferase
MQKIISVVVPIYNEEKNIPLISKEISKAFSKLPYEYEVIFVNDGSRDSSQNVLDSISKEDTRFKPIEFSRNFGKEAATTAGIEYSSGHAVIIMDADLQHPPHLIPEFVRMWEVGADVVIGLRTKTDSKSLVKHLGSIFYYRIINVISRTPIRSGATDYRLLDRKVVSEFNRFTERERITRGLIDWLGFRREFVEFVAPERAHGEASYSFVKLIRLAITSFISHSLFPLKLAGYLGIVIVLVSGFGGLFIIVEKYIYDDYLGLAITGTAQLAVLMVFFIGIVLSCLGLIALYIGNIHNEVSGRPLYIVRKRENF